MRASPDLSSHVGSLAPDAIMADFQRLWSLARQLRSAGEELAHAGSATELSAEPQLARALAHAESDWRHHRQQLAGFLTAAADDLTAAVAGYAEVDGDIRHAAGAAGGAG